MRLKIFWPTIKPSPVREVAYSHEFCKKVSQGQSPPALWLSYHPEQAWEWPDNKTCEFVCVITESQLVVPRLTWQAMIERLSACPETVAVPVYNFSPKSEQAAPLPAVYTTVSTFFELAEEFSSRPDPGGYVTQPYDTGCVICRSDLFPPGLRFVNCKDFIARLPDRVALVANGLVHRFGVYGEADRSDLLQWIPSSAHNILDIGCGRGWLGQYFATELPRVRVTGVESNQAMAIQARQWYREVHVMEVEQFTSKEKFDCIVCGDVLEHLENPWRVVKQLGGMLEPGGCMVVSVPNAGHWSLVRDLARGRFDYLPYGLTCITHIRWFTEASLQQMLEEAGLQIERIDYQRFPPTQQGEKFIQKMLAIAEANENSLRTHGFIARAFASNSMVTAGSGMI